MPRLATFVNSVAFEECRRAFHERHGITPSRVHLASALHAVQDGHFGELVVGLVEGLIEFAKEVSSGCVYHFPRRMRAVLQAFLTKLPIHSIATHTFVMDYMIRRVQNGSVSKCTFTMFVHDVSCSMDIVDTALAHKIDIILAQFGSSLYGIPAELCICGNIIACEDSCVAAALLAALTRMLEKVMTIPEGVPNGFLNRLCSMVCRPHIIAKLHKNEKFLNCMVRYLTVFCSKVENNTTVTEAAPSFALVLKGYMDQGPYFTNVIFLKIGHIVEQNPWLPLVEMFVTAYPSYPLQPSTWSKLKDATLTERESNRVRELEKTYGSKRMGFDGVVAAPGSLSPGAWHCPAFGA